MSWHIVQHNISYDNLKTIIPRWQLTHTLSGLASAADTRHHPQSHPNTLVLFCSPSPWNSAEFAHTLIHLVHWQFLLAQPVGGMVTKLLHSKHSPVFLHYCRGAHMLCMTDPTDWRQPRVLDEQLLVLELIKDAMDLNCEGKKGEFIKVKKKHGGYLSVNAAVLDL